VTHVLILNSGSSSLKWTVLDAETEATIAQDGKSWSGSEAGRHATEVGEALTHVPPVDAVGHRVVHGGATLREAVIINPHTRQLIADLVELAPLHNPAALAGIDAALATLPGLPQVAVFDTAFHATIPEPAATYPIPWDWTQRFGLRRFGFHGLSVQYAVRRSRELLGSLPRRMVVCHLGAGCSVTAVMDGQSIDTSMGFTPLEGLMMARRSGSVDPGLLVFLLRHAGLSLDELDHGLNGAAGLVGVSGVSEDWRAVESAAADGNRRAQLAVEIFLHRLVGAVGSMIGALGGLDVIVFTGGIGEHSLAARQAVAQSFGFAGLRLAPTPSADADADADADVAVPDSAVRALVITAREDLTALAEVKRLVLW
jgi:acetate kinase